MEATMLTKSLVKVGNSYAIVLDRTLMDLVGISPDVPVNLQVNGQTLTLSSSASPVSVDQAMDRVFATHKEALRRLSK
jgi:antitoxin component of MazEF toxin-antitoxin module